MLCKCSFWGWDRIIWLLLSCNKILSSFVNVIWWTEAVIHNTPNGSHILTEPILSIGALKRRNISLHQKKTFKGYQHDFSLFPTKTNAEAVSQTVKAYTKCRALAFDPRILAMSWIGVHHKSDFRMQYKVALHPTNTDIPITTSVSELNVNNSCVFWMQCYLTIYFFMEKIVIHRFHYWREHVYCLSPKLQFQMSFPAILSARKPKSSVLISSHFFSSMI